jgi:hypothetical protein
MLRNHRKVNAVTLTQEEQSGKEPRMRPMMLATLLAALVFGSSSGAFAQSGEIEADKPYYDEEYHKPTYLLDPMPRRPTNCGEFRYWDGERCVDARDVPPDIR